MKITGFSATTSVKFGPNFNSFQHQLSIKADTDPGDNVLILMAHSLRVMRDIIRNEFDPIANLKDVFGNFPASDRVKETFAGHVLAEVDMGNGTVEKEIPVDISMNDGGGMIEIDNVFGDLHQQEEGSESDESDGESESESETEVD